VWQSHFLKSMASLNEPPKDIPRHPKAIWLSHATLSTESTAAFRIPRDRSDPRSHNTQFHTHLLFCLSLWGTGITQCNIGLTKVRQRSGWNLLHLLTLRCRRACYEAQRCSKNKLRVGNERRKCEQMRAVTIY
jgi:hypothetical protein